MSDGRVIIDIDADSSGFEESLKSATNNISNSIKSFEDWSNSLKSIDEAYGSISDAIQKNAEAGERNSKLYEQALELLEQKISSTQQILQELSATQEDVNFAFQNNAIDSEAYKIYQEFVEEATEALKEFEEEKLRLNNALQTETVNTAIEDMQKWEETSKSFAKSYGDLSDAIKTNAQTGEDSAELYEDALILVDEQIEETEKHLQSLKDNQDAVNNAFANASISNEDYAAYQKDIADTVKSLEELNKEKEKLETASNGSGLHDYINNLNGVSSASNETTDRIKALESVMKSGKATFSEQAELHKEYQQAIKETTQHLKDLQHHENEVRQAFKKGNISGEEYSKFQAELKATSDQLTGLKSSFESMGQAAGQSSDNVLNLGDLIKGNLASAAIQAAVKELLSLIKEVSDEMINLVVQAGAMGNTIDKQSQRLGMSNEAYQEWSYILSQNGADISTLTMGMRTLTNKIDGLKNGAKASTQAFAQLGLSFKDLKGLTGEEQFSLVIQRLQGIQDETTRNAVANDVLGRSYMQLIPLLNQSSDSVENLRQKAHDTNQLMSDEGIKAAVDYTDAVDTLQRSFDGFKNNIGAEILPGITQITDGITDLINGVDGAENEIVDGVERTIAGVEEILPRVGDFFNNIILTAAERSPEIIKQISTSIRTNLPKIVNSFEQLASVVGSAIIDSLPEIGSTASTIVMTIFSKIVETLTDPEKILELMVSFGELGYNLCRGIADGIMQFDWESLSYNVMSKIAGVLDEAQRTVQIGIDKLVSGITTGNWEGNLYGGDKSKTAGFGFYSYLMSDDYKADLDRTWGGIRESYADGQKEIDNLDKKIRESLGLSVKPVEEAEEKTKEAVDEIGEDTDTALKNYTVAIENNTDEAKKKQQKLGEELQKEIDNLDHLFKTHKITEGEYWARKKALLEKYREDDNEEWHKLYDDVKNHYKKLSDKNKEDFKKAKKEEQDAISKAEKDYRNSLTKDINSTKSAFNNLLKEYQSGYNDIIKQRDSYKSRLMGGSVFEVLQKTDEQTGEQYKEYTINNLKDKLKQRTQYANEIAKLEQRELSAGLLKELESMDIGDATVFAKQINKMSDAEFNELNNAYKKLDEDTTRLANKRYQDELNSLNEDFVTKAEGLIDGMNGDLKVLGYDGAKSWISSFKKSWISSFKMGFDDSVEDFSKSINGLFDNLSSTVNDETQSIYQIMQGNLDTQGVGEKMIDTIINGLESKRSILQEKMRDLLSVSKYLDFLYADIASQSAKQSSAGYSSASAQTQTANQQHGTGTATQTAPQTVVVDNKQSGQVNKQTAEKLTIDANLVLTDKAGQIIADIVNAYNKRIEIGVGK